jgi:hypothetical protein
MEAFDCWVIDLSVFIVLDFGNSDDDSVDQVDAFFSLVFHVGSEVNVFQDSVSCKVCVDKFFYNVDAFFFKLAKKGEELNPVFFKYRILNVAVVPILPQVFKSIDVVVDLLFGVFAEDAGRVQWEVVLSHRWIHFLL